MARDLFVFDERMYHAGRRVADGKVTGYRQAAKFTLSLVFGRDNHHSERLYSYFRYARREVHYKDFSFTGGRSRTRVCCFAPGSATTTDAIRRSGGLPTCGTRRRWTPWSRSSRV